MKNIQKIGVFCGSNIGNQAAYSEAVLQLAAHLVLHKITLVYGGAKVGLMGMMADHALKLGGKVIGVLPKSLVDVEIAHPDLTELHVVNTMHERKNLIATLSDGFIMLPGGPGTLDEFFEMYTWAQLGYHKKPCGLLNVSGYYDLLLKFLDNAVSEGFLKEVHRKMIICETAANDLLAKFENYNAPIDKKWIEPSLITS